MNHFFPQAKPPVLIPDTGSTGGMAAFAGWYTLSQHSEFTYQKIILLGNSFNLTPQDDGSLTAPDERIAEAASRLRAALAPARP